MADTDNDPLIDHPSWYGQIRNYFTPTDVEHMGDEGIDLATYKGVVANAPSIIAETEAGRMPPAGYPKWSKNRVQTFKNWKADGFPIGTPPAPSAARTTLFAAAAPARLRKDVASLSADEIKLLKAAFSGMMKRGPTEADSYFKIAGFHWFPAIDEDPTFHCLHHMDRFLAWHRAHLMHFEDAMRSVEGCGAVTLPYWDVTTRLPPLLSEEPFASYKLQANIGHNLDPLTTSRNSPEVIEQNFAQSPSVSELIDTALKQSVWEQFNKIFWQAHDNGHSGTGPTMRKQSIAAFDPVFWLFHCNLDRLWLQWQRSMNATTVVTFKATCQGPTDWLDVPAEGVLPPFKEHAADTIPSTGVDYAPPAKGAMLMAFENKTGNMAAARRFRIDKASPLSIRVKDIDRSKIPGTFEVHLLADGKKIARQAFFQPDEPNVCPSCGEQAKVAVDFRIDPDKVLDKELSVEIHVPDEKETRFPLEKAGEPTINVRHLLEDA